MLLKVSVRTHCFMVLFEIVLLCLKDVRAINGDVAVKFYGSITLEVL